MQVVKRLLAKMAGIVAAILVIATINFALVHAAPGDPATAIADQSSATDEKNCGRSTGSTNRSWCSLGPISARSSPWISAIPTARDGLSPI